jgi:hypothetical protein
MEKNVNEKIVNPNDVRRPSAEEIEMRERQFDNIQNQQRQKAWRALARYKEKPTEYRRRAAIQAIGLVSDLASSENRVGVLLIFTRGVGPEIFWPVFMDHWNRCDAPLGGIGSCCAMRWSVRAYQQ